MKCEICGAEAQLIKGYKLCDEHKAMVGIMEMVLKNRKDLSEMKLTRMKWMEEGV